MECEEGTETAEGVTADEAFHALGMEGLVVGLDGVSLDGQATHGAVVNSFLKGERQKTHDIHSKFEVY